MLRRLLESALDQAPALDLSLRFQRAMNRTIQIIQRDPRIGRRRLREYPGALQNRPKAIRALPPFLPYRARYSLPGPGETKTVQLVEIAGEKIIRGGNSLASGPVSETGRAAALQKVKEKNFAHTSKPLP